MRQKSMEKRRNDTVTATADRKARYSAKFAGYCNFDWQDAQKEACVVWSLEFNFWDELNAQTEKGRRITVGYDAYHQCQVASCFERDIESPNAGYICTARGLDAGTAISRLLYLISELMPEGWMKSTPADRADKW